MSPHRIAARLERAAAWLRAAECSLCGGRAERASELCAGCERALPVLTACCSRCAAPLAEAGAAALCGACQQQPPVYRSVLAPFRYAAPVDRLILGAKYASRLDWLALLGRRLARHAASRRDAVDAAVAVPLHRARLRQRGYNQSRELLRPVAKALRLPVYDALARVRATPPQAALSLAERRRNVQAAFAATRDCRGMRLALVDDVMTSGATVEAAAQCLLAAGAASVDVWVVARA